MLTALFVDSYKLCSDRLPARVNPACAFMQDSYLWAGPLAYMIKTVLTAFIIVAVLRPFRAQHRRALAAEEQRPTGLRASMKYMVLDKWDNLCGRQSTTKHVVAFSKRTIDVEYPWWLPG